jgi:CheY-like chemotaxis protein
VKALIALDSPVVRRGLSEALKHTGFSSLTEIHGLPALQEARQSHIKFAP